MSKSNLFLRSFLAAAFLTIFFLSSCGKNQISYNNAYEFGTDFQAYMTSGFVQKPKIQETENGCVFYRNGFIYNYDNQSGQIVPLCSKTNCLHDAETDPEKKKECSAYLENSNGTDITLMLYEDSVFAGYSVDPADGSDENYCVCRILLNGSARDTVFTSEDILFPLIHRGYIYYFKNEYEAGSDSITNSMIFCRREINKSRAKEQIICRPDNAHGCSSIQAYGKYVYLTTIRNNGTEMISSVYDTESDQVHDLPGSFRMYTALNGYTFYTEQAEEGTVKLYRCDELGENGTVVLEDVPEDCNLSYDGKYYYLSGSENDGSVKYYQIFNENFETVDFAFVPESDTFSYTSPVGGEKYQYLLSDDSESGTWGLNIWDKSDIGEINYNSYVQTFISYEHSESAETETSVSTEASATEKRVIDGIEIPETTLNQTVNVEYTETEETRLSSADQWTDIQEADEMALCSTDAGKLEVMFSSDAVAAVLDCEPTMNEPGTYEISLEHETVEVEVAETVLIGEYIHKVINLTAYYLKNGDIYSCTMTMEADNTDSPDTLTMQLPDDAEKFVGAAADASFEYQQEYEELEAIENHQPSVFSSLIGKIGIVSAGYVKLKNDESSYQ